MSHRPSRGTWPRDGPLRASRLLLVLSIVCVAGCTGYAAVKADPSVAIRVRLTNEALSLTIDAPQAEGANLAVEVHVGAAAPERYGRGDLVDVGNGSYEVPTRFAPTRDSRFHVEVFEGGAQIGARTFTIADLGRDELPGLRAQKLSATYKIAFQQVGDGAYDESQEGYDIVSVDPSGRVSRLGVGRGFLNETLGLVQLQIRLVDITRTTLDGVFTHEVKAGNGTWQAVAPATGNGTIVSFRQEFTGTERRSLAGSSERSYFKQTTTAFMEGTFGLGGVVRQINEYVYWTTWTDAERGTVAWIRQRPGALQDGPASTSTEGAPNAGVVPFAAPWVLRTLTPVPAHEGDEVQVGAWPARSVTARASPGFAAESLGRAVVSHAWMGRGDDVALSLTVSADPFSAGFVSATTSSFDSPGHKMTVTHSLSALRNVG